MNKTPIERLQEILEIARPYVSHKPGCSFYHRRLCICNCGLSQIKRRMTAAKYVKIRKPNVEKIAKEICKTALGGLPKWESLTEDWQEHYRKIARFFITERDKA